VTICADREDDRPANMMRAVNPPLIITGCRVAGCCKTVHGMVHPYEQVPVWKGLLK